MTTFVRVPQRPAMFEATDSDGQVFAVTNTRAEGGLEVAFCRAVPPLRSDQVLELAHFLRLLSRELEDDHSPPHLLLCPRVQVNRRAGRGGGFSVTPDVPASAPTRYSSSSSNG